MAAIEAQSGIQYAQQQKQAITEALSKGMLILTGGPGTGKTTTLNEMCIRDRYQPVKEEIRWVKEMFSFYAQQEASLGELAQYLKLSLIHILSRGFLRERSLSARQSDTSAGLTGEKQIFCDSFLS